MSLKEVVDRDCGGSNPLMKLTTHFTEDKSLKQHGIGRQPIVGPGAVPFDQAHEHELVHEFLAQNPVHLMPTSFRMDSLLQEIQDIEQMYNTPLAAPISEQGLGSTSNSWIQEYKEFTKGEEKQSEWINEFLDPKLHTNTLLPSSGLWADEFLDFSEKETAKASGNSTDQFTPPDEVVATVDELLRTVDSNDPKFKNSKFIQFLHGLRDGSVRLEEKPEKQSELVADKWINEFTEEQHAGRRLDDEDVWVNEYVKTNFSGAPNQSWEDWSHELQSERNLGDQWSEELKAHQEIDFWENLQKQWDDLAKQSDNGMQDWLTQYDNFDSSTHYKNYLFEETNPLLDHPRAFEEGLERLRKGEISNAVLLFEAAVQKEPNHEQAWQYLGTTQASNEQDPAAIAALVKCLELNSTNLTALMALAVSYTNESLQQNACDALRNWIQNNPKYSHLLDSTEPPMSKAAFPKVSSFVNTDYLWQVRDVYLKAVQSNPQEIDPDVQVGLGILLNLSTDYDKAIDCFQAALQLKPDDALIWNKLGATMSNGGRSEEAVEAFRHALSIVPGYVRTRHNLGLACMNLGADREAMEHFLAALNLQKSGSGPRGESAVMSDNMWASVRTVLVKMGRSDLFPTCDNKDLETLNREFSVNV